MTIYERIRILFNLKYSFKFPNKNKVLVYDNNRSFLLKKYLKKYTIYYNRFTKDNVVYLNFIIKCLKNFDFKFLNYKKYFIKYVNPKVIITFNDNNIGFFELKKDFPNIKFIAIQAFWKFDVDHDIIYLRNKFKKKILQCDYFFCYNKYFADEYKKFIECKNFINIGSFESNCFPKKNKKTKNSVGYISQFKRYKDPVKWHGKYSIGDWRKSEKKFLNNLSSALKINQKLVIVGKNYNYQDMEYNYYKKILKKNFTFICNKRDEFFSRKSQYKLIDSLSILLTLDSTLAYESLARNKKVVFFSIRHNLDNETRNRIRFCWPQKIKKKGFNWTNINSKNEIRTLLKKNLEKSQEKWEKIVKSNFKDTFIYNRDNHLFKQVLSKLI